MIYDQQHVLPCLMQQIAFEEKRKDCIAYDHVGIHGFTFQECTGILDENGKDIYEGDICKFDCLVSKICGLGYVYWQEEAGVWMAKTILPFLLHMAQAIEIKGNIYENRELLENKQ
jgi:hypothetical protein